MPFAKGQSGNPGGRAKIKLADGRTLTALAREYTEEAVEALVKVMRNDSEPAAARVAAADKILSRGWGQAPQTINLNDEREPRDLSGMTDEQLEALETLHAIESLEHGVGGNC